VTAVEISDQLADEIQRDPDRFRRAPVVVGDSVVAFATDGTRIAIVGVVDAIGTHDIFVRTQGPLRVVSAWAPIGSLRDAADAPTRPVKGGRVLDLHTTAGVRRAVVVEQTYLGGPIGIVHPVEGSTLANEWALLPEALTMDDEGASPHIGTAPWASAPQIPIAPRPSPDPLLQQRLIEQLDRELAEARDEIERLRQLVGGAS
jgi:hypothetical protein